MSTGKNTIDFLLGQMEGAGAMSARKMFGEYGLYCDGKLVALVCDDQLFIKPTAGGKTFLGKYVDGCPYPGAKPCLLISGDQWDDPAWLSQLVRISATELPAPKAKPRA